MNEYQKLLRISIDTVVSACKLLKKSSWKELSSHNFSSDLQKEVKSKADYVLESEILKNIAPLGLPILSEESGCISGQYESQLRFIIDPLDGTFNYVRNLSQSSISIALYKGDEPIFGVLGVYPSCDLAWGGKDFGSYLNDKPISVSKVNKLNESVLCTGFPSRFQFSNTYNVNTFLEKASTFAKVRMLGSASVSLLQVAKGSAEVYSEQEIMLWDVAAGLAIVEGSGGLISISSGSEEYSLNVVAANIKERLE